MDASQAGSPGPGGANFAARGRGARFLRLAALVSAAWLFPPGAQAQPARFLSGPAVGEPRSVAIEHLRARHSELGLGLADLDDAREHRFESARTGTTHLTLRQRIAGIEVEGGDLGLAVDRDGRVFARWNRFTADAASKTNVSEPALTAREALVRAAEALDLPAPPAFPPLRRPAGPAREAVFGGGNLSRDDIPARLVYLPHNDELRLAWNFVIRTPDGRHWWNLQIDAVTGELLARSDWIARESYRVYPLPFVSPDDGPRSLEVDVADPLASPHGWHDTNGAPGGEFEDTRGNNVSAQEDADANDSGGFRPDDGQTNLVFDFPIDLGDEPSSYQSASITNLFYWNNVAHDVFYQYGFDEGSGNFQTNNYGRGGTGDDAVQADDLDGTDFNNAQFGTPPEGDEPRMEMFLWTRAGGQVEVTSPAAIAGNYPAGVALFGPELDSTGVSGPVVRVLGPPDACSALSDDLTTPAGVVAMIDRGSCDFVVKVKNAQDAGADAVIMVNNAGDDLVNMSGTDPTITIPSLFIGQSDGDTIKAELAGGVSATLRDAPARNSSLDAGVIVHEYGHGVTNRLTGGAANASCLQDSQSRSMGEGWSDFFALTFTARPGDAAEDPRPIAAYLIGRPPQGPGIRTQSYSTDLGVNDLTLADIATQGVPHGAGEVWAVALWEVYWELVHAYGYDPDLYFGNGGNNLALELVVDALKLQQCNPTYDEARDAVLMAEMNATGGDNECFLWRAFAKRGLGFGAAANGNPDIMGASEDFSVPSQCVEFCADGLAQSGEECDDGNRIGGDGCAASCEQEFTRHFFGTAQGGSVELVVEGVMLAVTTLPGETPEQVAANVAAAIAGNPTLIGLGVSAFADDHRIVTTGSIDSVEILDPGLLPLAPLGPLAAPSLLLALLGTGIAVLRHRED